MPRKRTASSSLDPRALFKQLLGAAVQAAANGPAGRLNFSRTVGKITDGIKHEAEAATREFKAHVQQLRRSLPPMKVRVLLASDLDWTAEPTARNRIEALRAAGFQELGGFRLDTIPNYSFVGFIQAEKAEMLRHDHAQRWLCNWLTTRPNSGVRLCDVLDTLVIVYDEMSADLVANAWWCGTGDISVRSTEFSEGKPLEVFREINRRRGEPLRLVCQKPPPFAADFYLPNPRPQPTRKGSALVRSIEAGLAKNDLRSALFDVRDCQIESDADAVAICDALRALSGRGTPDFARQVQALTRLFQQVPDLQSAAGVRLTSDGLPLLTSRFDELSKLRKDPAAGSAALLILQTLARYETAEGTDKVIAAARAGFDRDGLGWTGVFSRYKAGHPQTQRLLAWICDPAPENSGAAHTATAAIPFLGRTGRRDLLTAASRNPDLGVRMEAAWAEARLGQKAGWQRLVRFCGHWSSTSAAQQYLRELGRDDLIPASTREPSFAALAEMCDWLAHPNELGRVPDELQIVDHRELAWPPERVKKPLWVIRYRIHRPAGRQAKAGDHSVWCRAPRLKEDGIEAYEALRLRAHVGRQLLGL